MTNTQELPKAVIFDFDGTFCDVRTILHLLDRNDPHLVAFHEATHTTSENKRVFELLEDVIASGITPLLISARGERWRELTVAWLAERGYTPEVFHMRADDDFRSGAEYKRELLAELRKTWNIIAAIDDDPSVYEMWCSESIPTILVPGYNGQDDPASIEVPSWWNQIVSNSYVS